MRPACETEGVCIRRGGGGGDSNGAVVLTDALTVNWCHKSPVTQSCRVLSVFQSESEQDEEGTGSMGSAAVAVSPIFVSPLLLLVFRVTGEEFEHSGLWALSVYSPNDCQC